MANLLIIFSFRNSIFLLISQIARVSQKPVEIPGYKKMDKMRITNKKKQYFSEDGYAKDLRKLQTLNISPIKEDCI